MAVMAVGASGVAPVGSSHAQDPSATALTESTAGGLFGLWVQPSVTVPPAADVVAVVPLEGSTDEVLRVGVRFAQPFELPEDGYRMSVVVGDPSTNGDLRVSYRTEDGLVASTVEVGVVDTDTDGDGGDGDGEWIEAESGIVTGSSADAALAFELPRGLLPGAGNPEAPEPAALWVETEVPVEEGLRYAVSNYFAFAAFVPGALEDHPTTTAGLAPAIGASGWGAVEAFATSKPFPLQPALKAPSLAVANKGLVITTELPVPTAIDGQSATSVVDRVRLLRSDLTAAAPGYVQIDRISGTIEVRAADGSLLSAEGPWVGEGPDPTDPGAPGGIVVDLAAVATLLDLPADPEQIAVSADRTIELADQRTIVATATGAAASVVSQVTESVDTAPSSDPGAAEAAEATGASEGASTGAGLMLAVAVAVVVALVVVAVLWWRRRGDGPKTSEPRRSSSPDGPSPDEVIASLERQFSELGVAAHPSDESDDRGEPSRP